MIPIAFVNQSLVCGFAVAQRNSKMVQKPSATNQGLVRCIAKYNKNCFGPVDLQMVWETHKKQGSTRELPKMTSLLVGTSMRAPLNGASATRTRAREDSYTLELLPNVQLSASKKGHIQEVQSVERKWEQNGNRRKQ